MIDDEGEDDGDDDEYMRSCNFRGRMIPAAFSHPPLTYYLLPRLLSILLIFFFFPA
jgi:hypothetical protein